MKIADFEQIMLALTHDGPSGHLALLDAPTGSGKSYTIVHFLCHQVSQDAHFRAFFVTDQKKNLNIQTFKAAWEQLTDQPFYQKVAIIQSLEDTVQLLLAEKQAKRIPLDLQTEGVDQAIEVLAKKFKVYQLTKQQDVQSMAGWDDLRQAEYQVRIQLAQQLSKLAQVDSPATHENREKIRQYVIGHWQTVGEWLSQVYPTIDLATRQLYVLTTDKFIRSITPFFEATGKPFQFSNILKGSLVVLDEFDSTKRRVWEKSLADALKIKVDILGLFNALYHGILQVDQQVPTQLKKLIQQQSRYQELANTAAELNQTFGLDRLYKTVERNQSDSYVIHTLLYTLLSDQNRWHSRLNQAENSVDLGHHFKDELKFRLMLRRVSGFVRQFNRLVFLAAQKYSAERNSVTFKNDNDINLQDACYTIYNALGLTDAQIDSLLTLGAEVGSTKLKGTRDPEPDSYHEFQRRGLTLYQFTNTEKHDLRTNINAAFFAVTPENYLLDIISKANVLGLSATAKVPTVLDNYDLDYLAEKLGTAFIDGRPLLTSATKAEFDYAHRYQQSGITFTAELASIQETIGQTLANRLAAMGLPAIHDAQQREIIARLDSHLVETVRTIKNETASSSFDSQAYYKKGYIALFDSFIFFLLDAEKTSFLGLQAMIPSETPTSSAALIQEVFDQLSRLLCPKEAHLPKLAIISSEKKQGAIEDQLKTALALPSTQETRVYLLGAYQSIGIGQNLHHRLGDFERDLIKSIATADQQQDPRTQFVDLGGIYLGNVTHILTKVTEFGLNDDMLRSITELEYLADANEIGYLELKKQFQALERHNRWQKHPENVRSLQASYTRMVIQALGRMNRALNKVPHLSVLATSEVIQGIHPLNLDISALSPEVQALFALKEKGTVTNNFDLSQEEAQKQNLTAYTSRDVHQLLRGLSSVPAYATSYRDGRDFILRHPTIDPLTLGKRQQQDRRCLQYLPNPSNVTEYVARRLSESDFQFTQATTQGTAVRVSAEASGLVSMCRYPGLRQEFQRLGYAVEWQSADFIMNPIQYINLYLGALGEAAGKYIVEKNWGVSLRPFDQLVNNELFDFKTDNHVAVDFKNWHRLADSERDQERNHVREKLTRLEQHTGEKWSAIILNILGNRQLKGPVSWDQRVMEVSALIDEQGHLVLSPHNRVMIGEFLIGK